MRNFRGIDEVSLDFTYPAPTTVLAGINGSGKSSVLDCIAIMFVGMFGRIDGFPTANRDLRPTDINNSARKCSVEMSFMFNGEEHRVTLEAGLRGAGTGLHVEFGWKGDSLGRLFERLSEAEDDDVPSVPVAVYYPVNRGVVEAPVTVPHKPRFGQLRAFEGALAGANVDFHLFFQWFRNREDIENEERIKDSSHRDKQIESVRRAVEMMVHGFSDLRVRRAPPRMVVTKKDTRTGKETELQIDQLSDGEKCLIAMTGDLARRLAIANPGLDDPLRGEGVVLIDQIELHLHPAWQRMIIASLERTFPNCQFIVGTHSPQVLSKVRPEAIYLLEQSSEGLKAHRPSYSYGRDTNRILEELMGVSERPEEIQHDLQRYFRLIDEGRMAEARELRERLELQIGAEDPEFARADVLIRRKEILGR